MTASPTLTLEMESPSLAPSSDTMEPTLFPTDIPTAVPTTIVVLWKRTALPTLSPATALVTSLVNGTIVTAESGPPGTVNVAMRDVAEAARIEQSPERLASYNGRTKPLPKSEVEYRPPRIPRFSPGPPGLWLHDSDGDGEDMDGAD